MKRSDTVPPRRGTRTWRVAWGVVGLAAAGQLSMALTRPPSGEVTAAALDAAAAAADRAAKAAESPAPEVPAAGTSEIVPPAVPAPAAPSAVAESTAPAEKPAETADADPFTGPGVLADPHPEMLAPAGPEPAYDPAEALLREKGLPPPASQDGKPVIAAPVLIPPPVQSAPEPAPLDTPITDEYVLSRLEEGMHLRGLGDLQGALKPLREALEKQPDHPRLLYQLARTLDSMGLMRKAQPV